jgi:hypothetical protein
MFFIETLFVVFYTSILTTISSCTKEIIENVVYLYISLLLQTLYRTSTSILYLLRLYQGIICYFSGKLVQFKQMSSKNQSGALFFFLVSLRHYTVNLTGVNLKCIDAYAVLE